MENVIITQNLSFSYDDPDEKKDAALALDSVNVNIKPGEFVAILGHNGCGKSTFAKHLNAIFTPNSGDVIVYNINTKDYEKIFDIRQTIGMLFQNPDNQIVATVVEEDVAFALENIGIPYDEMHKRVENALQTVDMTDYKKHPPHQLSGGQKQRVAIAGILAMAPKCIVLDEPTAMLDPKGRTDVLDTIVMLNKEQSTTIVLITHYMEEAVLADRIIVMENGKAIIEGTPREVFAQVELLKSIGLDVPQATELAFELKKNGIDINANVLTTEEFVSEILKKGKSLI